MSGHLQIKIWIFRRYISCAVGFDEVSIEPVVGSGETFHLPGHIPAILDEYEKLAKNILNILNQAIAEILSL